MNIEERVRVNYREVFQPECLDEVKQFCDENPTASSMGVDFLVNITKVGRSLGRLHGSEFKDYLARIYDYNIEGIALAEDLNGQRRDHLIPLFLGQAINTLSLQMKHERDPAIVTKALEHYQDFKTTVRDAKYLERVTEEIGHISRMAFETSQDTQLLELSGEFFASAAKMSEGSHFEGKHCFFAGKAYTKLFRSNGDTQAATKALFNLTRAVNLHGLRKDKVLDAYIYKAQIYETLVADGQAFQEELDETKEIIKGLHKPNINEKTRGKLQQILGEEFKHTGTPVTKIFKQFLGQNLSVRLRPVGDDYIGHTAIIDMHGTPHHVKIHAKRSKQGLDFYFNDLGRGIIRTSQPVGPINLIYHQRSYAELELIAIQRVEEKVEAGVPSQVLEPTTTRPPKTTALAAVQIDPEPTNDDEEDTFVPPPLPKTVPLNKLVYALGIRPHQTEERKRLGAEILDLVPPTANKGRSKRYGIEAFEGDELMVFGVPDVKLIFEDPSHTPRDPQESFDITKIMVETGLSQPLLNRKLKQAEKHKRGLQVLYAFENIKPLVPEIPGWPDEELRGTYKAPSFEVDESRRRQLQTFAANYAQRFSNRLLEDLNSQAKTRGHFKINGIQLSRSTPVGYAKLRRLVGKTEVEVRNIFEEGDLPDPQDVYAVPVCDDSFNPKQDLCVSQVLDALLVNPNKDQAFLDTLWNEGHIIRGIMPLAYFREIRGPLLTAYLFHAQSQ